MWLNTSPTQRDNEEEEEGAGTELRNLDSMPFYPWQFFGLSQNIYYGSFVFNWIIILSNATKYGRSYLFFIRSVILRSWDNHCLYRYYGITAWYFMIMISGDLKTWGHTLSVSCGNVMSQHLIVYESMNSLIKTIFQLDSELMESLVTDRAETFFYVTVYVYCLTVKDRQQAYIGLIILLMLKQTKRRRLLQ